MLGVEQRARLQQQGVAVLQQQQQQKPTSQSRWGAGFCVSHVSSSVCSPANPANLPASAAPPLAVACCPCWLLPSVLGMSEAVCSPLGSASAWWCDSIIEQQHHHDLESLMVHTPYLHAYNDGMLCRLTHMSLLTPRISSQSSRRTSGTAWQVQSGVSARCAMTGSGRSALVPDQDL